MGYSEIFKIVIKKGLTDLFDISRFECTPNKLSVNINDLCLSYLSGDILKKILFFPCHFFNHFLCRNYYLSNYIGIPSIYTWGKFFLEISTFQVGNIIQKVPQNITF